MIDIVRKNKLIFFCMSLILLLISIIMAVGLGPVNIEFGTVWNVIFYKIMPESLKPNRIWKISTEKIIWNIRTPRVILGCIVGGGLALTGVSMQSFTKNPLSEPYILGVSSGASTGAVAVALTGALKHFGIFAMPMGAFFGSLASLVLVYNLAKTRRGIMPVRLILTGIAVSAMFTSITNVIVFNAKNETGIRTAMFWMMGSLAGAKWDYVFIPLFVLGISFLVLFFLSRAMNTMLLGEQTAITLGININVVRRIIIVVSSLTAGVIVAVSGSIGFVGLIIPHIVRNIMGSNHRWVIPMSLISGAIFVVWADVAARLLVAPQELPIGIVTSMTGAPFFVWLLKKNNYSFGG